jgi:hypothetical protein
LRITSALSPKPGSTTTASGVPLGAGAGTWIAEIGWSASPMATQPLSAAPSAIARMERAIETLVMWPPS